MKENPLKSIMWKLECETGTETQIQSLLRHKAHWGWNGEDKMSWGRAGYTILSSLEERGGRWYLSLGRLIIASFWVTQKSLSGRMLRWLNFRHVNGGKQSIQTRFASFATVQTNQCKMAVVTPYIFLSVAIWIHTFVSHIRLFTR